MIIALIYVETGQTGQQNAAPTSPQDPSHAFDEQAYLSGQIPLISGEPRKPSYVTSGENSARIYTYYLITNIPNTAQMTHKDDEQDKELEERTKIYDEQAFLQGKLNLYGDPVFKTSKDMAPKEQVQEKAPWQKDGEDEVARDLDEEKFLRKGAKSG
jgi:hypothetical protein